ncbi:1,4-alpha-glucan branching protein GlgB [Frigidibacter oleivorans]|uniref:1,4-alpha-glucan branching protein GlgB n=1 Tax=Frigidibacter oleivorans TaxID=2487129 RepID=UPI000F8F6885|nr:1,4-alpha-glucan branching protein GlgB [Frigidibacter oleivorans]
METTEGGGIDRAAAEAIAAGRHGDPFSVLGLHPAGPDWVLRCFVPGAERVVALMEDGRHPLAGRPDVPGFFAGRVPRLAPYRLAAEGDGATWEFDDPYRFGPVLGPLDEHLMSEGRHLRLWQRLGAHPMRHEGVEGTHFAVWAPNAQRVSVVGDFNWWDGRRAPMRRRGATGVWEIFLPGIPAGTAYKYDILGPGGESLPQKADPVGFGAEHPPATASIVRGLPPRQPEENRARRAEANSVDAPISIYEVHLGSWRRRVEEGNRRLSYRELASELVGYARDMGFTHLELLPISEYPFDGSWGYQPVGMFAPTIRHGTPDEFRVLVQAAHAAGLGVILDWVPGHFPSDAHGLSRFDGTALYEHADPKEGFHRDWNTLIYNYGRREVKNYLIANAIYWLAEYGTDGLRVDAVASMLYRDYSRPEGEWVPNVHGGRENLEASAFLREMNSAVYADLPGSMTVAEESTSFPGVSRPVHEGGLGFGFKWNMGWMNDTLDYIARDPVHRRWHHDQLTFGMVYAWSENFILPISHDEVVHGKGSMIGKMPGSPWEKFANLRAYYGFMWGHPGKKLLFMGQEFAQGREWNHDTSLDWHQLEDPQHAGIQRLVRDLNRLYRDTPALHVHDSRPEGFRWIDADNRDQSVLAFARCGRRGDAPVVVVCNFTPVERTGFRLGFPEQGRWSEVLNTDAAIYGGANRGNLGGVLTEDVASHGLQQSALLTLPPLSVVMFRKG